MFAMPRMQRESLAERKCVRTWSKGRMRRAIEKERRTVERRGHIYMSGNGTSSINHSASPVNYTEAFFCTYAKD